MIKSKIKLKGLTRENAQTMVEFALVFPIVLLITYGIIEFGRLVFIYAAVTGASREGARYGAAAGDLGGNLTRYYMDCDGILDAVQRGAILLPINSNNVQVWYDHGPETNHISNACPPLDANGKDLINIGDRIGVNLVARYEPMIAFLGLNGFDIHSENARTILVNVDVVGTPAPPVPSNTPTRTPGPSPTRTPNYTPTRTPTVTQTGTVTKTPTITQTYDPTITPTITSTPACIINNDGLEFSYDHFRWTLTSRSTGLVRLIDASLSWPAMSNNPAAANPPSSGLNMLANPINAGTFILANPPSTISNNHANPTSNGSQILAPTKKTPPPTPTDTSTPTRTPTSTPTRTPTSTPTPISTPATSTPTATATPNPYAYLTQINVGVNTVWRGYVPPPSASVSYWLGDESRRELNPGVSHTLTFSFSDDLPTGDYSGTLTYLNVWTGYMCSVSFSVYNP